MTATKLEYAEKRMQQKWYELVQAEEQGASQQALERLYSAYMLRVEEYNRCVAQAEMADRPAEACPIPFAVRRKKKAS